MQEMMMQKVMVEKKKFFDVWMYEASDDIQNLAKAFGERYMLESAIKNMQNCPMPSAKALLEKVIFLHSVSLVRKE